MRYAFSHTALWSLTIIAATGAAARADNPPTVTIAVPANGAAVFDAATLDAVPADDVKVASVDFYEGSTLLCHTTATLYGYLCAWDTTKVPVGAHSLTAVAVDSAGQRTTSAAISVSVYRTVNVPADIAIGGAHETTDGLGSFIAGVAAWSRVVFPASASYRMTTSVPLVNKTNLIIEGNGASIVRETLTAQAQRYPNHNEHITITGAQNVTIRNLSVVGTNTGAAMDPVLDARGDSRTVDCVGPGFGCYSIAFAFEAGFAIRDSVGIILEDCASTGVWGDGVYIAGATVFVHVTGQRVERNGRMGFGIVRGNAILIEGAEIVGSRRAGFDFEPNAAGDIIENVFIRNSHVAARLLPFTAGGNGIVRSVEISGNLVTAGALPMVHVAAVAAGPRHGFTVKDNTFTPTVGSNASLFQLTGDAQAEITHNEAHFTPSRMMTAVSVGAGGSVSVHDNWFQGAADAVGGAGTIDEGNNSLTGTPPPGF